MIIKIKEEKNSACVLLVRMDAAMERDRLIALEKERAKEEAKKR